MIVSRMLWAWRMVTVKSAAEMRRNARDISRVVDSVMGLEISFGLIGIMTPHGKILNGGRLLPL